MLKNLKIALGCNKLLIVIINLSQRIFLQSSDDIQKRMNKVEVHIESC